MKNIIFLAVAIFLFAEFMISCGGEDNSKPEGSSGGNCFSNGTCNIGLECHLTTNVCFEKLEWSETSSEFMTWYEAVTYCNVLDADGYSNWRLPTISELRTLIENCLNTEIGGECGITDNCLSKDCFNESCRGCFGYGYSIYEDTGTLWTSSEQSDDKGWVWTVIFTDASVLVSDKNDNYGYSTTPAFVRCVR